MAAIVHRVDMKQVTLVLKMPRLFSARMWLTIRLIRLAALVSPTSIEISHDE